MNHWLFSRRALAAFALVVVYALCFLGYTPPERLQPGRHTTYFTGPLNAAGFVDFGSALNAQRGLIGPAANAAVPLLDVVGPQGLPTGSDSATMLRLLGLPATWTAATPLQRLRGFVTSSATAPGASLWGTSEHAAAEHPWDPASVPHLFAFVTANDRAWSTLATAAERQSFCWPAIPDVPWLRTEPTTFAVDGILLEAFRGLRCRAMLRVHQGDLAGAWQDLRTNLRVGHLLLNERSIMAALNGLLLMSKTRVAMHAWLAGLQQLPAAAAAALAATAAAELDRHLDLPEMSRALVHEIRFMGIGLINDMAQGRATDTRSTGLSVDPFQYVDFNTLTRGMNARADALERATIASNTRQRVRQIDAFFETMAADNQRTMRWYILGLRYFDLAFLTTRWHKAEVGAAIVGDILAAVAMPHYGSLTIEGAALADGLRQNRLALTLYLHKLQTGQYPADLAELGESAQALTIDSLAERPFVYRREGSGFVLYGVGPNLSDNGGQTDYATTPDGSDVVIRLDH